jgi:hypothetical protein
VRRLGDVIAAPDQETPVLPTSKLVASQKVAANARVLLTARRAAADRTDGARRRTVDRVSTRAPARRFHRVELDICYAAINVLDEALKHELLRELATELAAENAHPRNAAESVRAAVAALRDAADVLGHSPSVREYRALRESLRELGLVPDATLRRWLGGGTWNECLERALLNSVFDGDLSSAGTTDRFSEREIVDAIRECAAEQGGNTPTLQQYLAWARQPDVRARRGRRPLSWGVFARHGGFREVLARNGLIRDRSVYRDGRGRIIPSLRSYTSDELLDAVRGVAKRLGHTPRQTEYDTTRWAILDNPRADPDNSTTDEPELQPSVPTSGTLVRRYGNWTAVLAAAGVGEGNTSGSERARSALFRRGRTRVAEEGVGRDRSAVLASALRHLAA